MTTVGWVSWIQTHGIELETHGMAHGKWSEIKAAKQHVPSVVFLEDIVTGNFNRTWVPVTFSCSSNTFLLIILAFC